MATTRHRTAHLEQPSGTEPIEEEFLRAVARRIRAVRGLVRRTVGYENDALGLKEAALADERDDFGRGPPRRLARRFEQWFREVLRDELLEPMQLDDVREGDHWTADYLRQSYISAWQQATGRLQADGVGIDVQEPAAIIQMPVSRRQLRDLYARTYENLESITEDMAQTIREELTEGVAAGENPRKMASRLNEEIDDISRTRLQTLARTEVINSHTEATLDRYETAGVDTVQHGEWADADDDRVCPICSALDGREVALPEMRTGTFQFDAPGDVPDYLAGEYPLRPPAHPNCRCSILPVVS